jgi:hypothetical protein
MAHGSCISDENHDVPLANVKSHDPVFIPWRAKRPATCVDRIVHGLLIFS